MRVHMILLSDEALCAMVEALDAVPFRQLSAEDWNVKRALDAEEARRKGVSREAGDDHVGPDDAYEGARR